MITADIKSKHHDNGSCIHRISYNLNFFCRVRMLLIVWLLLHVICPYLILDCKIHIGQFYILCFWNTEKDKKITLDNRLHIYSIWLFNVKLLPIIISKNITMYENNFFIIHIRPLHMIAIVTVLWTANKGYNLFSDPLIFKYNIVCLEFW